MTNDLQILTDRWEIEQALVCYSVGLDQRRWELWDRAFAEDAIVDFSTVGMATHTPAELKVTFSQSDPVRISGQHLLSNILIELDGDKATTHAEYSLTTLARTELGGSTIRTVRGGGWYEDRLERRPQGWRIVHRQAFSKWMQITEATDV